MRSRLKTEVPKTNTNTTHRPRLHAARCGVAVLVGTVLVALVGVGVLSHATSGGVLGERQGNEDALRLRVQTAQGVFRYYLRPH